MSSSIIINRQYSGQVADFPLLIPRGRVIGNKENGSDSQKWQVVSVGNDYITIWNAFGQNYAFPPIESKGASLLLDAPPYKWQLLSDIPGGWYQIATTDGKYVWRLPSGEDLTGIILADASYKGEDAQWGFNPSH